MRYLFLTLLKKSATDQIDYAEFNGDSKYLYKGTWVSQNSRKPDDKVYNSYSAKKELDRQLNGRRQINSVESLSNDLFKQIARSVANKIENFNPEG